MPADLYQEPERLRKATLKIERNNKCYNDADYADRELCGASKLADGKACKVGNLRLICSSQGNKSQPRARAPTN